MDEELYIQNVARAKAERRKALAALPVHEKVRIMIEMQKMVAPLLARQGKMVKVWEDKREKS